MKRSEMVEIIASVIASFRNSKSTRNDCFVASKIIKTIENAGMLPPLNKIGKEEYNTSDLAALYITKARKQHKWDK